ncbi:hypothetical protein [Chryseobacterium sp. BIGb0232]|uniref:hypothetical protein n=1 Tax=Chryseobacterium sp. BIGb0232 TaxID=2940598 RepID=UPI000F49FB48|nr:hypothetical protein [Chryseobacterium sp. BIGb0232]MCS4303296.1 hypothetical protein [Chryseobacterium sp. BIGb0232]ROS11430.1 hypothetical protein EDF65_3842 [Chryseobacterium nakagawai]
MHQLEVTGNHQVEIHYDGTTVCFIINKEIHSIVVAGPYQTAQNYFHINCTYNNNHFNELDDVRYELDHSSLAKIEAFLKRFESGNYSVFPFTRQVNFVQPQENNVSRLHFSMESNSMVISTQPLNSMNRNKINEYKEKINKGESPIVFLYSKTYSGLELEEVFFIVSGNEVLKAYQELEINPKLIALVNSTDYEYDSSNQEVLNIISSHKEIRDTSYLYFY